MLIGVMYTTITSSLRCSSSHLFVYVHWIVFVASSSFSRSTWLRGRCGRHNSPPASSVMDFIFHRSDGSHISVDTVHPSLIRSSSLSSHRWYHLQSLSSDIVVVSPLYVAKPPQPCFPAPLCDTLYLQSLHDVIVSHMVS